MRSPAACHRDGVDSPARVVARRLVVLLVVATQLALVVRGYSSAHRELAFQMFPEASTWQADVVRVTTDGRRVSVAEPWAGYRWDELVTMPSLQHPDVRQHADAGARSQVAYLAAALDWVAAHTPDDGETRYLEATVTTWHNNVDAPEVVVLRSHDRHGVP